MAWSGTAWNGGGSGGGAVNRGVNPSTRDLMGSLPSLGFGGGGGAANSGYWTDQSGNGIPDPMAYGQATNPQYTYYQGQIDQLNAKAPFLGSYYDTKQSGLNQDYNTALAGIGLQQKGMGIDRGANARDIAYYDAMKAQAGLERANVGDQNNTQLATQGRDINNQSAAAGNWFSGGRDSQINDAYKGWGQANTAADISYTRDILGLDKSRAAANDANSKLDIMGQQLGLDRDKLKNNLTQGLASLGYDRFTSMDSLLSDLNSANANKAQLAQQILQQAIAAGDTYHSGALGDKYSSYSNYTRPGQLNADR